MSITKLEYYIHLSKTIYLSNLPWVYLQAARRPDVSERLLNKINDLNTHYLQLPGILFNIA